MIPFASLAWPGRFRRTSPSSPSRAAGRRPVGVARCRTRLRSPPIRSSLTRCLPTPACCGPATLEELIDVGLLLDRQAAPAGRRVALIGNAGGPLVLGADAADAGGLDVPLLSPRLQDEIASLVPTAASTENPVDLGSAVTADRLAAVVQAVGASGEVDACVVVCVDVEGRHRLDERRVVGCWCRARRCPGGVDADRCRCQRVGVVAGVPDAGAGGRGRGAGRRAGRVAGVDRR